jgi:hypothetical protein
MAQSGHHAAEFPCLLLGVKRTSEECAAMSAFYPERKSDDPPAVMQYRRLTDGFCPKLKTGIRRRLSPIVVSRCMDKVAPVVSEVRSTFVCLVDQMYGPRTVVHADWRRRAALPVVKRIAQRGEIGRSDVGAGKGLVAVSGREL